MLYIKICLQLLKKILLTLLSTQRIKLGLASKMLCNFQGVLQLLALYGLSKCVCQSLFQCVCGSLFLFVYIGCFGWLPGHCNVVGRVCGLIVKVLHVVARAFINCCQGVVMWCQGDLCDCNAVTMLWLGSSGCLLGVYQGISNLDCVQGVWMVAKA